MKKLFVFDLDNCIFQCQIDYNRVYARAVNLFIEVFGWRAPHPTEIIKELTEIEADRLKTMGFQIQRFPGSWTVYYREIVKRYNLKYDSALERQFLALGYEAFNPAKYVERGLVEGAAELLQLLKQDGHYLVLATKGDEVVQRLKVKVLELEQYFHKIDIVSNKDAQYFADLILLLVGLEQIEMDCPKWAIGDSYESDIKSALASKFHGLLIPFDERNWMKDRRISDVDKDRVMVINDILELEKIYKEGGLG